MMEQVQAVLTVIGTLILMILIFVGAYFASKLAGGATGHLKVSGQSRIEILDKSFMGKDKYLVTVRVAGKVLLLGVSPQQIQKLDELDSSLFPEGQESVPVVDFKTVLKDAWKQRTGKRNEGDEK